MELSETLAETLPKLLGSGISTEAVAEALDPLEAAYLTENFHCLHDITLVWAAMDAEWEKAGAGFHPGNADAVREFYASPVWLLNGIFTETDPESQVHRAAVADLVLSRRPGLVVDFGGGFGTLARRIAAAAPETKVVVAEPHPTRLAQRLASSFPNVAYEPELPDNADIVIAQDVLEHVTDPLADFARLITATKSGGLVITANCFQPVIRCHYPGAFHLHFTFPLIAARLGCRFEGTVNGAPHAQIFRKLDRRPNWPVARMLEGLSKLSYPVMLAAQRMKRILRPQSPEAANK